jgi:hypothetical protein
LTSNKLDITRDVKCKVKCLRNISRTLLRNSHFWIVFYMVYIFSCWTEPRNFDIYISHNGGWGQSYEMLWAKRCNTNFQLDKYMRQARFKEAMVLKNTFLLLIPNISCKSYVPVCTVYWCLFKTFYHNVHRFFLLVFTLCVQLKLMTIRNISTGHC